MQGYYHKFIIRKEQQLYKSILLHIKIKLYNILYTILYISITLSYKLLYKINILYIV